MVNTKAPKGTFTRVLETIKNLVTYYGTPREKFADEILRLRKEYGHLPQITLNKTSYPSSNIFWGGHTPEELTRALKEFVSSRKYNNKNYGINSTQRTGITEYKHLRALSSPEHPDEKLLKKYYLAFNKIFFLRALKNIAVIQVQQSHPRRLGDCSSHRAGSGNVPPNAACLIRIYRQTAWFPNNDARLEGYLGTLCHEMLHAMYALYCCDCSEPCRGNFKTLVGDGGHQPAWQTAALAIENATTLLLNETITLNRHQSLAHDWHLEGAMPFEKDIDVKVWGTTYDALRSLFEWFQNRSKAGV